MSDRSNSKTGRQIPKQVKDRILKELAEIEEQHEVKIFYACESGSRAWGYGSGVQLPPNKGVQLPPNKAI